MALRIFIIREKKIFNLCAILLTSLLISTYGFSNEPVTNLFQDLAKINRYSPVEGAGSHGSLGFSLGLGIQYSPWSNQSVLQESTFHEESESSDGASVPKLYLTKGLYWPIDVGISIGNMSEGQITQLGGHLQWTIFEAFRLPALALRGSFNQLSGLNNASFSSLSASSVLSFSLFRVVTLFAEYGIARNSGSIEIAQTTKRYFIVRNCPKTYTIAKAT